MKRVLVRTATRGGFPSSLNLPDGLLLRELTDEPDAKLARVDLRTWTTKPTRRKRWIVGLFLEYTATARDI
jgi:hypothetical protein